MARTRFARFAVSGCALLSVALSPAAAGRTLPAVAAVEEDRPIKPADARLLGFNHEWAGQIPVFGLPGRAGYDRRAAAMLQGLPLPLNRMSGTPANAIKWKEAVGPMQQRGLQKLVKWWQQGRKLGLGPVEWIEMVRGIDPRARFTWTVNLLEPPEDTADLVEFLTGDGKTNPNGGVNWARKRIEYGLAEPVRIDVWELGNELDGPEYRDQFKSITTYTELCRRHIAAIRSVRPDARFAAQAATFSSLVVYAKFFGGTWEIWHRTVLREIGSEIDYLAFHTYYNSLPAYRLANDLATIAADIRAITGSDRIKIYVSEHAWWPKSKECPPGSPQWKKSWFQTHALIGCLGTADWMTRMLNSPAVTLAAYHSIAGGPWSLVNNSRIDPADGSNRKTPLYTTGIVDLFRLLNDAFRDAVNVVPVRLSGPETDPARADGLLTAAALTTPAGVNLILVNRDPQADRSLEIRTRKGCRPTAMAVLTAPELMAYNTEASRPITVSRRRFEAGNIPSRLTIPAKSLTVIKMTAVEK